METLNFTTEQFIKGFRPLRKLPLTLSEVNALEYLLSYQLQNLEITLSDRAISNYIMMKPKSVNNLINKLADIGYIAIEKHNRNNPDEKVKRFLKVNIEFINGVLDSLDDKVQKKMSIKKTVEVKTPEAKIINVDEELPATSKGDGNQESKNHNSDHSIENNESSLMLSENKCLQKGSELNVVGNTEKPIKKRSALDYDELRVIGLMSNHTEHRNAFSKAFPDLIKNLSEGNLTDNHVQYLTQYHAEILLNEQLRNEYRTIK